MLRSVRFLVFISISILTALPAQSAILSALPQERNEYEKVFGYEPTEGELKSLRSLQTEDGQQTQAVKTLRDFQNVLDSREQTLIMIGHNEEGVFRFASGESKPIGELSQMVESSNKVGVFLTCHGSCYTDAPAPRFKINWINAFALAAILNRTFANSGTPPDPGPVPPRPSPSVPSKKPTSQDCLKLGHPITIQIAKARGPRQMLHREIGKTIFRAEMNKVISTGAKIVAATTAGGAVVEGVFYVFLNE